MDLAEEIRKNPIALVVLPKANYLDKLPEVIRAIEASSKKTCYVTLNKPYTSMAQFITGKGFQLERYFFIDSLTSSVQTPPQADNCEFIQSPSDFTDMGMSFTKAIKEKGCDTVFFDAVSTLAIYQSTAELVKFIQNLITKARVFQARSVYLALKEDSEELVKDLTMFVDGVIEVT